MSSKASRYFSYGRTPSESLSRTQKWLACASASSIASTHSTTSAPSIFGSIPGTRWTPSSTIDQPSSSARSIAARTPTSTSRVCSRKPSITASPPLVLVGHRAAGSEARVVDRRHELLREERAHRLADEVGRGHAGDPEPVGDVGRDGRLARARRAADEQDDRQVELVEVAVAAQAAHGWCRPRARGSRAPPPRGARASSPAGRSPQGRPRRRAPARRPGRRETGGDQRPRHQALRERQAVLAAERHRLAVAAVGHLTAHLRNEREQLLVDPVADELVVGEDQFAPSLERRLGDDVDRSRLDLDQVDIRVDALELLAQRAHAARGCRRRGRPRRRAARPGAPRASRARTGRRREVRHAAAGDRLDRPGPQLDRTTGTSLTSRDRLEQRPARAAGDDDEVGDQDPVRVQVARRDVDGLRGARDEHARVDLDRRDRRAAAVEDDDVGPPLRRERCAREHVRLPGRPREPAPAAPAADRRNAGERCRLEVVGGRVPARARELEQALERGPGLGELRLRQARRGPSRPRPPRVRGRAGARGARSPRSCRPACPCRPRPATAARTARRRADRSGSRRPRTGARARARGSRAGTARAARARARPRGRSRPPARARRSPPRATRRAARRSPHRREASRCRPRARRPTTSCGSAASASRTTGA